MQRPARRTALLALLALHGVAACRLDNRGGAAMNPTTQPAGAVHTNRLARATSPYLQQHQHNPVDWYEWGPEALEKARREDKPIFLSIGYSACHWCHVMAHESFEDPQVAAIMNKHFVNIKVDREERPDLDDIYMHATMIFNRGQGGWPMSVWLTPELKPFAAGTYFPPTARWGRPGFGEVCERIGQMWRERRAVIEQDAQKLVEYMAGEGVAAAASRPALTLELIDRVVDSLAGAFDAARGGLVSGGSNKFPPSMALELLLRAARRETARPPRRATLEGHVRTTLDHMAAGGIFDHLAGGIARYSTDEDWLVPHFEKMLYDQALVSHAYIEAAVCFDEPRYRDVARAILDYVLADLRSPEGGFYSARDADSEGVEGKYYVWRKEEVLDALGEQDGELFCSYYDVSEAGNWQDPHDPGTPKNILHAPRDLDTVARLNRVSPDELAQRLAAGRTKLLEVRARRVPPHRDEKILVEWNGLMIAALARGGAVLDEPRYVQAAAAAAEFILREQHREGRLRRSYRDGRTLDAAFLADYAALIDGLIELYEATFEPRWLRVAQELNGRAIADFWDEAGGGFFTTAHDHEQLILRRKDLRDSATPSGNSLQLHNLLRLAVITGDAALRARAERMIDALSGEVLAGLGAAERFLAGVEFARAGAVEIALVGDPADARTRALVRAVRTAYLPNRVVLLADPRRPAAAPASPLLTNRGLVNGAPAAYVCRDYVCKLPVTSAAELARQLREP
jgi:hypothetical protein